MQHSASLPQQFACPLLSVKPGVQESAARTDMMTVFRKEARKASTKPFFPCSNDMMDYSEGSNMHIFSVCALYRCSGNFLEGMSFLPVPHPANQHHAAVVRS